MSAHKTVTLMLLVFSLLRSARGNDSSAVIDENGHLVRGIGALSSLRYGPGRYEVSFKENVGQCRYTASIGDPANALVYNPGLVFTAGGHSGQNGVYIETKNLAGGLADYPFHISLDCPAQGIAMKGIQNVSLVREQSSPAVYLIVGDTKFWIVDASEFWAKVRVVADGSLNRFTEGRLHAPPRRSRVMFSSTVPITMRSRGSITAIASLRPRSFARMYWLRDG